MIAQERADFFEEIENEFPVDKWIIDDVEVWPLMKFEINKILKVKNESFSEFEKKSNKITIGHLINEGLNLLKFPFYYLKDFKNNQKLRKNTEVVFLTQSTRRNYLFGSYYDRICDPYIDALKELKKDYVCLEWTYDHKYKLPRTNSSRFIQPALDIFGFSAITFKKKKIDLRDFKKFDLFLEFLDSNDISAKNIINTFRSSINLMFVYAKYFENRLRILNPKYAFLFPFFGIIGHAFILACSRLKILSIDIQHGFYHKNEPLYYGLKKVPENGFKLLPNVYWCWDEMNKNGIEGWNKNVINIHKPFVGGNLWINRWKNKGRDINETININHRYYKFDRFLTKLLVTFSPFYYIPEWLPSAVKSSEGNCIYGIRFHHNTPKDVIKKMEAHFDNCSNVEFKYSNELPLPAVLMNTDIHVTIESSCLVEAKELGIPSILISSRGESIYFKELGEGWAVKGYNENEFLTKIKEMKDFNRDIENKVVSNKSLLEDFFNSNLR